MYAIFATIRWLILKQVIPPFMYLVMEGKPKSPKIKIKLENHCQHFRWRKFLSAGCLIIYNEIIDFFSTTHILCNFLRAYQTIYIMCSEDINDKYK